MYIAADGYISLKPIVPCYCYFTATNCNLETNRYDAIIAPYLTDLVFSLFFVLSVESSQRKQSNKDSISY